MDLAAAKAGVEVDPPPHVDGVIETVVRANGAPAEAPLEELSEEEIFANQRLQPGIQSENQCTRYVAAALQSAWPALQHIPACSGI